MTPKSTKRTRSRSRSWRVGLSVLLPALLLLAGSILASPASADGGGTAGDGQITGLNGSCLDDWGGNFYPGAPVDAYAQCNGSAAQQWSAFGSTGTNILLSSTYQPLRSWYCLDVNGGQAFAGNQVQIWPCNGQPSQNWAQYPGGALHFDNTNFCLDVPAYQVTPVGASSPIQLDIWPCNGDPNQNWSNVPGLAS